MLEHDNSPRASAIRAIRNARARDAHRSALAARAARARLGAEPIELVRVAVAAHAPLAGRALRRAHAAAGFYGPAKARRSEPMPCRSTDKSADLAALLALRAELERIVAAERAAAAELEELAERRAAARAARARAARAAR